MGRKIGWITTMLFLGGVARADLLPLPFQLEVRSPVGVSLSQPSSLNEGVPDKYQAKELLTFGADAMVFALTDAQPWMQGWGLGVRFDSISSVHNDDQNHFEALAQTFSLMLEKRYTFGASFLAPFATVGFYQPGLVNQRFNNASFVQYKADRVRSGSLGVEGGWILDVFLLGGEIGYQYLTMDGFSASDGSRLLTPGGSEKTAQLSGVFLKLLLGVHF